MTVQAQYVERMLPHARVAAAGTGLPVSLILAQWALETGWGRSRLARDANNHGGIKGGERWPRAADGVHSAYPSVEAFVGDYIRVMRLPFYTAVLAAARAGRPVEEIARLLCASPYAEDPLYGDKVIRIWREQGLARHDVAPVPVAPPAPVDLGGVRAVIAAAVPALGWAVVATAVLAVLVELAPRRETAPAS